MASKCTVCVIQFEGPSSSGCLFVKVLAKGQDGEAVLMRCIDTGELVVRTFPLQHGTDQCSSKLPGTTLADNPDSFSFQRSTYLPPEEVLFMRKLTRIGLIPRYISTEGTEGQSKSLTIEYCNGGTVLDYYERVLAKECRAVREAYLWLVLAETFRAFVVLHHGYPYISPTGTWVERMAKGKFMPPRPEHRPWRSIFRSDGHINNIFVTFSHPLAKYGRPQILLSDFSRAGYAHGPGIALEEMSFFLRSLLSLRLPALNISKMIMWIRQQMEDGRSLLDLVKCGLYEECITNFHKLDAKFPIPQPVVGGGMPKTFDLSQEIGHSPNLWAFRKALESGNGLWRVLRIPKEDVVEPGEVSIARAKALAVGDVARLIGYFGDRARSPKRNGSPTQSDRTGDLLEC